MKVIIAGSRFGVYPDFFEEKLNELFLLENSPYEITEVISGCSKGVDTMAIDWAAKNDIPVTKFLAEWDNLGPAAGPIRNANMADYGDLLVAFFNAEAMNRGTKNMCTQMHQRGKKIIRCHEKLCRAKQLFDRSLPLPPEHA